MNDIVKDIQKVIVKQQEVLYEQLNFGACDASISLFKLKISYDMPEGFYMFYEAFNGSVEGSLPIWGKMTLLPLSGIVKEKERMDKSLDFSNWNKNWLPFLMEDKNSFVCINLNDKIQEEFGNIIQYNSKKSFQPILFKSFKNWLDAFYEITANFDKDIILDNSLYRSYFNSKIADLIQ